LLEHQERLQERKSHLRSLLDGLKESENISTEENAVPVAAEDWSGTFEWDSRADDIRFNVFGISSYRANQREVINLNISFSFS
jgi:ATP-dependent DNA helicase Q1